MIDDSKYMKAFIAEAEEGLQDMNRALLELEKDPGRREIIDEMFRHAHTIRGYIKARPRDGKPHG